MLVGRVVGVEGLNDAGLTSLTEVLVLVMMSVNTHCVEITKITILVYNSRDLFSWRNNPQ
jgi:hypothetical protein